MVRGFVCLIFLTLLSLSVQGGVIIDFRDKSGRDSQFLSDDQTGRLNLAGGQGYILLDYATQGMRAVIPERKQVIELSGELPSLGLGGTAPEKTPLTVDPEGEGPEILGYDTQRYRLSVNGEFCGTVFTSTKALADTGLDHMFRALQKLAERTMKSMGALQNQMSTCQRGLNNTIDHIPTIGAPLRSLDKNDKIDVEVTHIQTDATLAADTFSVPEDYAMVNFSEKMKQVESQLQTQLQKLKNNLPETEKKLADLEKNGKISPQVAEKLRLLLNQQEPVQP
ncbi:MAG: hypothetical protein ACU843_12065 [Gammaproteobacteria bacterium]